MHTHAAPLSFQFQSVRVESRLKVESSVSVQIRERNKKLDLTNKRIVGGDEEDKGVK